MNRKWLFVWIPAALCAVFLPIAWGVLPILRGKELVPSTTILARDGSVLYEVAPPAGGSNKVIPFSRLPRSFVNALVASEDARFFFHRGVDWLALIRASVDAMRGHPSGGASTIEMQLVKTVFFAEAKRTPLQKMREIIAATAWTAVHTKEETLERYANTVAFGQHAAGVASASEKYFQKDANNLSLAESAMLAGMIPSPSRFDPYRHRSAALERMTSVLRKMRAHGFVTDGELADAEAAQIVVFAPRHEIRAPHFVLRVLDEAEERFPEVRSRGLIIRTTLDPVLQREAEEVISRRLARLEDQHVTDAAAVAVDPRTGDVLAYLGSADFFDDRISGKIDMAAAKRQPGSALKPFLFFEAFRRGKTPATIVADLPVRFDTMENESYYPKNYNARVYGPVSLRDALGSSLNVPAVKLLDELGLPSFFETLAAFGLTFPEPPDYYGLSVVLGGGEVSLFDVTRAYAKLARYGDSVEPRLISEIRDAQGHVLLAKEARETDRALADAQHTPQAAYLVTDILADRRARSRAFGETSLMEVGQPIAVKTGTTKDFRDNWAFGYTPSFVLGVWVGNADNSPMNGVSGITGAVPIWHDIMQEAIRGTRVVWPRPDGIVDREICSTSGLLSNGICPKTRIESFIAGTEPTRADTWYVLCNGKSYLSPPVEFDAWKTSAGHERIPDSCLSGGAQAAGIHILSPFDGEVFTRATSIASANVRIPFTAAGRRIEYRWILDGQPIVSREAEYLWKPEPGEHTLLLEGADGQVRFVVE